MANYTGTASNADIDKITGLATGNSSIDIGKQDTLISGDNVKTVGGTSILGSGDIPITGGSSGSYPITQNVVIYNEYGVDVSHTISSTWEFMPIEIKYDTTIKGFQFQVAGVAPTGNAFIGMWKYNNTTLEFEVVASTAEFSIAGLATYSINDVLLQANVAITAGAYLIAISGKDNVGSFIGADKNCVTGIFGKPSVFTDTVPFANFPKLYNAYGAPANWSTAESSHATAPLIGVMLA